MRMTFPALAASSSSGADATPASELCQRRWCQTLWRRFWWTVTSRWRTACLQSSCSSHSGAPGRGPGWAALLYWGMIPGILPPGKSCVSDGKTARRSFRASGRRLMRSGFAAALHAALCKLPTARFAIYGHGCGEDCIALFFNLKRHAVVYTIVDVKSRAFEASRWNYFILFLYLFFILPKLFLFENHLFPSWGYIIQPFAKKCLSWYDLVCT